MNWTLRNSRQKLPSWNNQALIEEDPALFVLIRAAGLRWSWVIQTNKLLRIIWEFFSKTSLHPLSPWLVFNSSQPWMSKIAPIPDGDPCYEDETSNERSVIRGCCWKINRELSKPLPCPPSHEQNITHFHSNFSKNKLWIINWNIVILNFTVFGFWNVVQRSSWSLVTVWISQQSEDNGGGHMQFPLPVVIFISPDPLLKLSHIALCLKSRYHQI